MGEYVISTMFKTIETSTRFIHRKFNFATQRRVCVHYSFADPKLRNEILEMPFYPAPPHALI